MLRIMRSVILFLLMGITFGLADGKHPGKPHMPGEQVRGKLGEGAGVNASIGAFDARVKGKLPPDWKNGTRPRKANNVSMPPKGMEPADKAIHLHPPVYQHQAVAVPPIPVNTTMNMSMEREISTNVPTT
ncbi:unnamed protein product [Calicophoron daubneyi]|uniref:Secreted protein n=1 Tax=Calicophoron daubneyi TaxID=300641 RepID=A0AAV2TF33_CALDB